MYTSSQKQKQKQNKEQHKHPNSHLRLRLCSHLQSHFIPIIMMVLILGRTSLFTNAASFVSPSVRAHLNVHTRSTHHRAVSIIKNDFQRGSFLTSSGYMNNNNSNDNSNYHSYHSTSIIQNKLAIPSTRMISSLKSMISEAEAENNNVDDNEYDDNDDDEVTKMIRKAYLESETDGILQIAPTIFQQFDTLSGYELIISALDAVQHNKGQAAGIINAFIASCCNVNDGGVNPDLAWDIYKAWEDQADELGLYPDIVTFCSTYTAMIDGSNQKPIPNDYEYYIDCAQSVLSTAEKYSKKKAGTKRRKKLVSLSRRSKGGGKDGEDGLLSQNDLETLQELYGIDFNILHEDQDCIIISKPSGMVCFHSRTTTDGKIRKKKNKKSRKKGKNAGNNNNDDSEEENNYMDISLEDALLDIGVNLSTLNSDAMGIVHRIDRGTSGCIILAKNNVCHARLVTSFFRRCVDKSYIALVPNNKESDDSAHNESTSTDDSANELEQSGIISFEIGGRPALSNYNILSYYGKNESKNEIMKLKVETKTGRKHQVRVHCAKALGRPILLDPIYSTPSSLALLALSNSGSGSGRKKKKKNVKQSAAMTAAAATRSDSSSDNDDENLTNKINQMMDNTYPNGHRFFLHASSLKIDELDIDVSSDLPHWWEKILSEFEN
jgi:23S rRNA-/tRNA-specific pseudouridylate synthase